MLSAEHIFGKWLIKEFGRTTKFRTHSLGRPTGATGIVRNSPKAIPGDVFDSKISNVCEECNNTWMSEIHSKAQPLIIDLAKRKRNRLTSSECFKIARWVAMVSLNLECQSRIIKTPHRQRTMLMNGEMPDGWEISCGYLEYPTRSSNFEVKNSPVKMELDNYIHLNVAIICIENVIFKSKSTLAQQVFDTIFKYMGHTDNYSDLTPIWPINSMSKRIKRFNKNN